MDRLRRWILLIPALVLWPSPVAAQDDAALRVFLDCQGAFCDQTFIRQEVHWIDWVRDRQDADVQVLVTSQGTGGGGQAYQLDFIGLGEFDEVDDRIGFATSGDATPDTRRRDLIRYLTLGLARYVARTPAATRITVGGPPAEGPGGRPAGPGAQVADPADDPWNFWVFNISARGFAFGSSGLKDRNIFGNVSANRTTELWKFRIGGSWSESTAEYDIGDGQTVESTRDSWGANGLLARSIGERWAVGVSARAGAETFNNYDLFWRVEPGIEYNFFPYSDSSRRLLTASYSFTLNRFEYVEETIYGETAETRWQHGAAVNLDLTQPWGTSRITLTGNQYLHDADLYNVRLSGNMRVRLFRGFSVDFGGSYTWVRDQLSLEAGGLTPEEILTRQRQQATSFRYNFNFGVSYRFGSIFNNIVNPRFGTGFF